MWLALPVGSTTATATSVGGMWGNSMHVYLCVSLNKKAFPVSERLICASIFLSDHDTPFRIAVLQQQQQAVTVANMIMLFFSFCKVNDPWA